MRILFSTLFFLLAPIFSFAQVGVNLPQAMVGAYIETKGIVSAPTDGLDRATFEAINAVLLKDYDNMPPQDFQMLINNNAELKQSFINKVTAELANNYVNQSEALRQTNTSNNTTADDTTDPTNNNFQIVPANCYGTTGTVLSQETKDLGNCGWRDIIALINRIMKFLVYISASLSTLAFAYAGFLYMTAFGNSGKIEQAHGIFSKTLIGIMFVLLGWLLVATLLKVLGVNESFSLLNMNGVKGL